MCSAASVAPLLSLFSIHIHFNRFNVDEVKYFSEQYHPKIPSLARHPYLQRSLQAAIAHHG